MDELEKLYQEYPHLRGKSKAELKRQEEANKRAAYLLEREEKKSQAGDTADKINAAQERLVAALKELDQFGFLPDDIKQAHCTTSGTFAPHLKYKPVDAERVLNKIDADSLMGASKPKRTRKQKD